MSILHRKNICILFSLFSLFSGIVHAEKCGVSLGEPSNISCNEAHTGSFNTTVSVPNDATVGQVLFDAFPPSRAGVSIRGASGESHYTVWASFQGTSLAGVCPNADNTMFNAGNNNCLIAMQASPADNSEHPPTATPFPVVYNTSISAGASVTGKALLNHFRIIYLGSSDVPTNMPLPPSVNIVDSVSQVSGNVFYGSSAFHVTANMQTCSGGGTTITLDSAVPTADVGATFGTSKQSTYQVQCPKLIANTYSLQTTFSGPALDGYTGFGKSSGSAEGVGFQMKVNNTLVGNGSVITDIPVDANGLAQLNFDVSYIKTAPVVTPGDITSTVTISYLYQ